jgi:predicted PurR-regulated permease PerM
VVFAVALFLAYMLSPLVGLVERFTPKRVSRVPALAIVYLVLIGLLVALGITLGSQIADEANSLAKTLPAMVQDGKWVTSIPLPDWLKPDRQKMIDWAREQFNAGGSSLIPYLRAAGEHVFSGARYLLYIVLVPILAFFLLKDGRSIIHGILASIPDNRRRQMVEGMLDDINLLLGKYIRALVLLAICSFAANSLFLGLTGAPYAVLLAGIACLGEFIPVIGPLAAGVLVVVVTGLTGYPHLLWFVIFWALFRMFQDYVLSPNLMSAGVELDPMLVLFGVLAGEQIAGVAGMFFSVPAIAILRVLFVRSVKTIQRKEIEMTPSA